MRRLSAVLAVLMLAACAPDSIRHELAPKGAVKLLNASYDVSRDFYKDYNPLFQQEYGRLNAGGVYIQQSHGGSSKQALAVANGLQADVVTMNQESDIELLEKKGLVRAGWEKAYPNHASPFTSTTVFLVRKGNPKNIRDWQDLARDGVKIVMANPKVSGNGRYGFLAAYGAALKRYNGDTASAQADTARLLANVEVFENGGRAATTTFAQRGIGDVLVNPENELRHTAKQFAADGFEVVYPHYSVEISNPVAVVDAVADKRGSRRAAAAYLNTLWSRPAQELAAKHYLRPSDPQVLAEYEAEFPAVETFRPIELWGSWDTVMQQFFADGGLFDRLAVRQP